MVRHVLSCVAASEWPTRVEALDALVRRLESGRRDGLRIDGRPAPGRVFGAYATRRRNWNARPYSTVLLGLDPIASRCDCPDFVKNALGVCKHGLVVLEHLYSKPRLLKQGLKEQEQLGPTLLAGPPGTRSGR